MIYFFLFKPWILNASNSTATMKEGIILLFFLLYAATSVSGLNETSTKIGTGVNNPAFRTTVIGKVIDQQTKAPLEYTTISIFSSAGSLTISGGLSDQNGYFSLGTDRKKFSVKLEYLAYLPKIIDNIELPEKSDTLNLGIIELMPNTEMLGEVEVRAEKSSVVMSLDKRVFNVGKDLVSQGGTAEDILRNVPGVWVDINGKVSLRSSGGVRILVDGQTSLLINGKNSDGLRQIRANAIEHIEIITNPSARYEAEGMAGIINIVMKKNNESGLNGSVSSNIGHPDNFGIGVSMNYLKNKLNFFAGSGIWYINRPGTGSYRNRFFNLGNPDSTLFSNLDRTHENSGKPINFKIGADYFINPKNTLTNSFSYRKNKDRNTSNLVYKDAYGSIDNVHLITERLENETGDESNINGFLRHKKTFSNKEHQLTSEIRYESEQEDEISIYEEAYFDRENFPLDTVGFNQITQNKSDNKLILAKSDYILPIGKASKFEGGFQSTFRTITDDYKVSELINSVEIPDSNFTSNFKYHEIIHGIYADFGSKIGHFSYQVGMRVEHSNIQSGLGVKDRTKTRQYANFFPSAFIGYDFQNQSGVQLSYSRRIERPTFLDLTPFFTLRDRRNIWRGNPNIRPEFTHAIEFGYIKYWEKETLSAIAYYRKTDDVIKRIQRVDERFPETTITQAENLDIKRDYGIEFTYSLTLVNWWKLNGDMNFFHSFSEGTYQHQGQEIYVGGKSFSFQSKTISRFTFWKKLNSQLTLSYAAPRTTTQGVNKATTALDFATSIDLIKNNGTVTLNISDIFNSRRRRSFSEDETFYSEDNFLWQSRAFVLSFHYRINQHKKQSQIYSSPIRENNEERF